jgi:hypothetical protein
MGKMRITSCTLVFGIFHKNAIFQAQVINLVRKFESVFKGKNSLDMISARYKIQSVVAHPYPVNQQQNL